MNAPLVLLNRSTSPPPKLATYRLPSGPKTKPRGSGRSLSAQRRQGTFRCAATCCLEIPIRPKSNITSTGQPAAPSRNENVHEGACHPVEPDDTITVRDMNVPIRSNRDSFRIREVTARKLRNQDARCAVKHSNAEPGLEAFTTHRFPFGPNFSPAASSTPLANVLMNAPVVPLTRRTASVLELLT